MVSCSLDIHADAQLKYSFWCRPKYIIVNRQISEFVIDRKSKKERLQQVIAIFRMIILWVVIIAVEFVPIKKFVECGFNEFRFREQLGRLLANKFQVLLH